VLTNHENGDPPKVRQAPEGLDNLAWDQLDADALEALAKLKAHGTVGLPLLLRFGETLSNKKATLKHGQLGLWCREVLKRSPSWCSAHLRLHESRADLEPALDWAVATNHRLAHCRSVERLLKVVADWRKATQRDGEVAPATRRQKRPLIAQGQLEQIAAQLQEILTQAEDAFESVSYELFLAAPPIDGSAKDDLMALARRFRPRLRDLGGKLQALQLSKPAEEAAALPPIDEAPGTGRPH
jgi:hypothetical protein